MHFDDFVESIADSDHEDGQCWHREFWSGVLCSETLIRRTWEDLFLKGTRITCSIRHDQTWRSKNFMSNLSICAPVSYNDKRKSKDWHCRTHNTDLLNLEENKFEYKKNYLWRKNFSEIRKSEICTEWEKLWECKNFQCKSWKKIARQFKSSLPIASNARTNEFYEWLWRFSRCGIKLQWKILLLSQSIGSCSKSSWYAKTRQTLATRHVEYIWITGKRFWKSTCINRFIIHILQRNTSLLES